MDSPPTTREFPITDDMATWLAETGRRQRTTYVIVLVFGVLLLLFGGLVGLSVAAVSWLVSRDPSRGILELAFTAAMVAGGVAVWRYFRARETGLQMDLRDRIFLRTTSPLTLQEIGVSGASQLYELRLPDRKLILDARDGPELRKILQTWPGASKSGIFSREAVTVPNATVDYTKHGGFFLALRDSAGEVVYRASR
jgi:hypothetical protein